MKQSKHKSVSIENLAQIARVGAIDLGPERAFPYKVHKTGGAKHRAICCDAGHKTPSFFARKNEALLLLLFLPAGQNAGWNIACKIAL